MPDSPSGTAYRAFISYSHRDKAWGDWLHKALETYRVPRRLVGQQTEAGVIPQRLAPVFRDREDLASATDLGGKVNEALARSENLIVICSPAAAASRWVNEEVLAYKRIGRAERIFCLIVGGEPNASDIPGRAAEECFCPALRFKADAKGEPSAERTEPIAADAREDKDGKANAKLKLIAGLLGVGFDALRQRELQRRVRRMTAIAALAVAVMTVTSVLAITAMIARRDALIAQQAAERRQKQAEDLVGFMLGDLGDKLDQVHRFDIMQAVDDKALAYFDSLSAADATDSALSLRVKALEKIGSVRMTAQGQLAAAEKAYQSAASLAAELVKRAPADATRQAVWGDSLKWLGQAAWYQGNLAQASENFQAAVALLQKAHASRPQDKNLAFDLATSQNNAGRVLEARGDFAAAQTQYEGTLKLYQDLAAEEPANPKWQSYLGDGWDNLGKLALERGDLAQAITSYVADQRIKAALFAHDPVNHNALADLVLSDAILGRTVGLCGDFATALRYTDSAVTHARELTAFDSTNTGWQEYLALYSQQAGKLLRQDDRHDAAAVADAEAIRLFEALIKKDPLNTDFQQELAQAQLESARQQLALNAIASASAYADSALASLQRLRAKSADDRSLILLEAQAHLVLGQAAAQRGETTDAQQAWTQARGLLQPALRAGDDPNFMAAYAESLLRLDQIDTAQPVISKLNSMGYRAPDFVALLASRRITYAVNAAFQRRLAQILQPDAPDDDAAVTTSDSRANGESATAKQ